MPPSLASRTFRTVAWLALGGSPLLALKGLGWRLRGKRVRGWNQLCRAAAAHPAYYRRWTQVAEPRLIEEMISRHPRLDATSIAVLVVDEGEHGCTEDTVASARAAFGENAAIYDRDGLASLGHQTCHQILAYLASRHHSWILPIRAGDTVSPFLGQVLDAISTECPESIVYWDEDRREAGVRTDPWIKPDWDELLFLARDCLSGAAIFRMELAAVASPGLESETLTPALFSRLAIRMAAHSRQQPRHVPLILTHRRTSAGLVSDAQRCAFVARDSINRFQCIADRRETGFARLDPQAPVEWPKVSILIPTKDRGELLEACTSSLGRLDYRGDVEIIIVDNGTTEAAACAVIDRIGSNPSARIIVAPGPFNFSALINLAAKQASGELLCLLNNDVEAVDGSWLESMVRFALIEDVGAVGAQLLYPDRSIQHAGVAIGIGGAAGHVEKARPVNDHQFAGWHSVTRQVSAVTAACMMIRADLFKTIGGLDELGFPVAFNDVDLCLRLVGKGYRNLLVAEAQLIHHESVSRGDDLARPNVDRFKGELANLQERWATPCYRDPHFSPLFSKTSEQCLLAF